MLQLNSILLSTMIEQLDIDKLGVVGVFTLVFTIVVLYFSFVIIKSVLRNCCKK
jgi:hypothetical protein